MLMQQIAFILWKPSQRKPVSIVYSFSSELKHKVYDTAHIMFN